MEIKYDRLLTAADQAVVICKGAGQELWQFYLGENKVQIPFTLNLS